MPRGLRWHARRRRRIGDHRRATRRLANPRGLRRNVRDCVGVAHHQGVQVLAQQALHQGLQVLRRLDKVRQAALHQVRHVPALGHSRHQRGGRLRLSVHGPQRGEGCPLLREPVPRAGLLAAGCARPVLQGTDALARGVGPTLRLRQLPGDSLLAGRALPQPVLAGGEGLLDLREAALVHLVLYLRVADLVAELCVGHGLLVCRALGGPLVRLELSHARAQLAPPGGGRLRRRRQAVHLPLEGVPLATRRGEVACHLRQLGLRLGAVALRGLDRARKVPYAGVHVAALLGGKARVGLQA